MRPGPLGVAIAASREMYWWTCSDASSSEVRRAARASGPATFIRSAVRANLASSARVAASAALSDAM
jgi:hypothetical protein